MGERHHSMARKGSAKPIPKRSIVRKPARRPTVAVAKTRRPQQAARPSLTLGIPRRGIPRPVAEGGAPALPTPPPASAPLGGAGAPAPSRQAGVEERFTIPNGYGEDRIVLMVKDPWWLFAYWEIQPSTERAARAQLRPEEVAGLSTVLRVYDVTPPPIFGPSGRGSAEGGQTGGGARRTFDIALSGMATNWYIHTEHPHHAFIVDIGLLTTGGRFLRLARSNRVTAPRFGPSDVVDEAWMTTDELYWKLFGAAGVGMGASESSWATFAARPRGSNQWSSGGFLTPARQPAVRGFWFRMDAELIIHGATEPRATLLIQGQRVPVRRDGSFTLRLALPEGTQALTVEARSADGTRTNTVTPVVSITGVQPLAPVGTTAVSHQTS